MYCKNCGQQIDDDDLFCANCGAKIVRKSEAAEAAAAPKQMQNIKQPKSVQIGRASCRERV